MSRSSRARVAKFLCKHTAVAINKALFVTWVFFRVSTQFPLVKYNQVETCYLMSSFVQLLVSKHRVAAVRSLMAEWLMKWNPFARTGPLDVGAGKYWTSLHYVVHNAWTVQVCIWLSVSVFMYAFHVTYTWMVNGAIVFVCLGNIISETH